MRKRKKQGSATFLVIMVMTVILILSFSLVPLTLSSINQSTSMYRRNKGFYGAEGSLEKVLYHIDAFSERARKKVNEECFDMKNKVPNMNDIYIAKIFEMHSSAITAINKLPLDPSEKEFKKEEENKLLDKRIKSYYMYRYNLYLQEFFLSNNSTSVQSSLNLQDNVINQAGESFFTWNDLKSNIETSKDNGNQKIVLIEGLHRIKEESKFNNGQHNDAKKEFERFIPVGSEATSEFTTFDELKKLPSKEQIVNPVDIENEIRTNIMVNSNPFKETFYIKTQDDKNTVKYASVTVEMDPLRESEIKTGSVEGDLYSSVLDYGIITEKNLAVGNDLTVNSDVIVNGQGEPSKDLKEEVRYGGIISGHDQGLLSGKLDISGIAAGARGNLTVNGDAYVGRNIKNEMTPSFQGGFVQVATNGSTINIRDNAFCHTLMVGKGVDGENKDSIKVGESAFIADNVTLNGYNANINIGKNIVGYEDGAETDNKAQYLSSPAIAINKYEEDNSTNKSMLKVGGQVTLLGEVFAESWFRTLGADEPDVGPAGTDVLYKTFQTVGIYGNLYAFSEYFWVLGLQSDKNYDDKWYSTYEMIGDPDLQKPDFIDKYKVDSKVGSSYILDYLNNKDLVADGVVSGFDLGKGWLEVPNINISGPLDKDLFDYMNGLEELVTPKKGLKEDIQSINGASPISVDEFANRINGNGGSALNISYFNSFFLQDGKIYINHVARPQKSPDDLKDPYYDYDVELIKNVNEKLGGSDTDKRVVIPGSEYDFAAIRGQLNNQIFEPMKLTLSRRLNLEDVVTYKTLEDNGYVDYKDKKGLDRCFNWNAVSGGDIVYDEDDKYIHISNKDINIPSSLSLEGKDVLIISGGNVVIDSAKNVNIKGNIMAKGNIVTNGSAIELTPDKTVATKLINHNKDPKLGEFFKVSSSGEASNNTIETITKQNKTNINVIGRRELLN